MSLSSLYFFVAGCIHSAWVMKPRFIKPLSLKVIKCIQESLWLSVKGPRALEGEQGLEACVLFELPLVGLTLCG